MSKLTFKCWKCGKNSTYEKKADDDPNVLYRLEDRNNSTKDFTYYCIYCGTANTISFDANVKGPQEIL